MNSSLIEDEYVSCEIEEDYEGQWVCSLSDEKLRDMWFLLRKKNIEDECKLLVEIEMYARGIPT